MPGTVLKVCGGWVVVGWLKPILVVSLSLDQAEQKYNNNININFYNKRTSIYLGCDIVVISLVYYQFSF